MELHVMEFTDWMLIKAGVMVALALVYGFWRGITGQPLEQEPHESGQDLPAARDD